MLKNMEFIKGRIFHLEESESVEFKSISSGNPVKTIVAHAEEYVLGFLNAQVEGNIYFGIEDLENICGVKLTKKDKDDILKNIPNKFRDTGPHIPSKYYGITIECIPVMQESF